MGESENLGVADRHDEKCQDVLHRLGFENASRLPLPEGKAGRAPPESFGGETALPNRLDQLHF